MKTGNLIVEKKLVHISFENFPNITLGVNTNEDGSKSLNGEQKWYYPNGKLKKVQTFEMHQQVLAF